MTGSALPGRIRVEIARGIGTLIIDRPEKKNSLTPELCDRLAEQVRSLDADPSVRIIALRGAGRDFSAGADIRSLREVLADHAHPEAPFDHLSAVDEALGRSKKPTVALVQGICMGGGWQLASACDIVLCSDDAALAITPALVGIVYPRRGVERLVRQLGASRAKDLLFSGDRIDPGTAERWGLVTRVIEAERFAEESAGYLERVASRSQYSVHTTKALIDLTWVSRGQRDAAWDAAWERMPDNPDLDRGQAAFLAGERPEFVWSPQHEWHPFGESSSPRAG